MGAVVGVFRARIIFYAQYTQYITVTYKGENKDEYHSVEPQFIILHLSQIKGQLDVRINITAFYNESWMGLMRIHVELCNNSTMTATAYCYVKTCLINHNY